MHTGTTVVHKQTLVPEMQAWPQQKQGNPPHCIYVQCNVCTALWESHVLSTRAGTWKDPHPLFPGTHGPQNHRPYRLTHVLPAYNTYVL